MDEEALAKQEKDLAGDGGGVLGEYFRDSPGGVRAWEKIWESSDEGIKLLRKNTNQLEILNDLVVKNNLGLDADGILDILNSAAKKGQKWDFPENILDAVKRASDANIPKLKITHKKFPESAGSGGGYLLPAKNYQKAASGDANLSFEVGGRSFDDIGLDGTLIDRKYGYENSIFDKIENEFGEVDIIIHNPNRVKGLLTQAKGQLDAANGKPIRWEISTSTGAQGIQSIFNGEFPLLLQDFPGVNFSVIEVINVPL